MRLPAAVYGVVLALVQAGGAIAQVLPEPPGPLEQQARPVSPETPVPPRLTSRTPEYPAAMQGGRGLISIQITLDAAGKVAEVRRVRAQLVDAAGPINQAAEQQAIDALVQSAKAAVREWTFAPPTASPLTFPVAFNFYEGMIDVAIAPPIAGRGRGAGAAPVAGLALPASWPAAEGAYRVGGAIAPPVKRKDARPDYPKAAQEARVSGAVVMEVLIGPNGKVRDARVLRSVPLLDEAALKTVRKWEYTPTLVNGKAVPVVMTVTLTYRVN